MTMWPRRSAFFWFLSCPNTPRYFPQKKPSDTALPCAWCRNNVRWAPSALLGSGDVYPWQRQCSSSDGAGPFCVTKRTWVLLLSYSGTGERLRVRILVFEWLTFLSSGVFLSGWLFRCMYILGRDEKEAVVSIWGLRTLQTLQQRKDAAESVCGHSLNFFFFFFFLIKKKAVGMGIPTLPWFVAPEIHGGYLRKVFSSEYENTGIWFCIGNPIVPR